MPEHGKYVKVWRRLGAWLIVADCWSRTRAGRERSRGVAEIRADRKNEGRVEPWRSAARRGRTSPAMSEPVRGMGRERRPADPGQYCPNCSDEVAREPVQVEVSAVRVLFELLGFLLRLAVSLSRAVTALQLSAEPTIPRLIAWRRLKPILPEHLRDCRS